MSAHSHFLGHLLVDVSRCRRAVTVVGVAGVLLLGACSGGDDAGNVAPPAQAATPSQPAPSAQTPVSPPAADQPADGTVSDPRAELDVDDQAGRGRSVRVEDVLISNGTGHVAVFAASGRLLGAAKVSTTVRRLTVSLDRPVPRTSELLAVLYSDDGDQRFEAAADPRIVDEDGDFRDDSFDYRLLR